MNLVDVIPDLGRWAMQHQGLVLGGLAGLGGLALSVEVVSRLRQGQVPLTTHGSARFATAKELRQAGLSTRHGVVIGDIDGVIYCDDWVTHVLTVGVTRSGKGNFHIQPTLRWFWRQGSVLCTDPKNGENLLATQGYRAQYGRVEVFAPYRSSPTKINVCDAIRWQTPFEYRDALVIARSITAPKHMGGGRSDSSQHFWPLAAAILAASQLHVWYTTGHCSLGHVWQFLTQLPGEEGHNKVQEVLKVLRTTAHVSVGVHEGIAAIGNALAAIGNPRELGSVWSTATLPLYLYNDPYVAQATDSSTLDLRELQFGPEPVSLFLLAESPAAVRDMGQVYRAVIETAIKVLMRREGEAKPDEVDHRLLLCLDEFDTFGYMPVVNDEITTIAGYQMKAWLLCQDIPQLDLTYGENGPIWGNTHTKLFHAPANDKTAERISKQFLGTTTVEYDVHSKGGGMGGRGTVTPHRAARALLTTDEVMNLAPGLGIGHLTGRGVSPFLFGKVGFDPHYREPARS